MILKALSLTVDKHPEVNRTVRFGGIYQREVSSVFFHVLPDEGDDLSGLVFRAAHEKATEELNKAFLFRVKKAKEGKAPLEEGKKIFQIVPGLLSKWVLDVMSFVNYSLNLRVGAPADAFGSVMLTSVGSLDIPRALTPIAPYTKNSMVVSMGTARNAAVVKDGVPAVSRLMTFGFVFDHRLMEGKGFASFIKEFRVHFRTTRSPDQIERIEWMQ